MTAREFEISIGPQGEVEVHVKGYKGRSCLDVIKLFESIVGEVQSQRNTQEFYEPEEQVRYHIDQRF